MWRLVQAAVLDALLLALMLPLAAAAAWPGYVGALGGGPVHQCHCGMSGSEPTCSCPICHPFDKRYRPSREAIRGTCGDYDDSATHELVPVTVPLVAVASRICVPGRVAIPIATSRPPQAPDLEPPVPPPRGRAA